MENNEIPQKPKEQIYKKITGNNENYLLNLKIKDNNLIYISLIFDGDNKIYEDIKSYEDIIKVQTYFEDYNLEEIYDELDDLISKNNFELKKNNEQILFSIVLPFKKRKTIDFKLEIKNSDNFVSISLFQQIIKQKDEDIKQKDEFIKIQDEYIRNQDELIKGKDCTIKEKDQTIKEQYNTIKSLEEIKKNTYYAYFNINHTPKNELRHHGNETIYSILQLQDGRLASGGNDGSIIIYNKQTFVPELTIKEHQDTVYDIIQLKNGNLLSCSHDDKTMKEYKLNENNTYQVLSTVNVGQDKDNYPRQIVELENNEIGLVAYNNIIFYSNINNNLINYYKINYNSSYIGNYYEMILVKPGELVIAGSEDLIQFFEIDTKEFKEIINIKRDIHYPPSNLLCMMNERCLCVGGKNKITIIDVYNKNIISEVEERGVHRCLYKLNDNILLTGNNNGDIIEWKINGNNLLFVKKKENVHQHFICQIIGFNNDFIISCSEDYSIKIVPVFPLII